MRILIYGLNYAPELTGIGKYTGEMVAWLQAQGHHVCVVTTPPYYPAWQIGEGYSTWWYGYEETERLKVYRCPLWVPKSPSVLNRILHLLSFALTSLPVALWLGLWWRPDLMWVVAPAIFSAPGALLASRLGGAKSWLHIQDFEIDAAFDLGLLGTRSERKNSRFQDFPLSLERLLLQRFDYVSTIAPAMLKILEAKGVEPSSLVFFPNWVDTEIIYPLDTPSPMRQELGIPLDRIVVLYSGNMGKKQGLEIAIASAKLLSNYPNILFILCGDGVMRSDLEEIAEGLDNLMFLPLQPLAKLNDLLNLADIHILPQRSDVADLVMPSKLGGILACGGAAIATAHPHTEVANVVQASGGIVCLPDDAQHFAEAILTLAQDPAKLDSMKQSARSYALQNLAKEEILSNFHSLLTSIGHLKK